MTSAEQNYNAGASRRAEIFEEINANPVKINRQEFVKTAEERKDLKKEQRKFKGSGGLKEWNERNRPGNNKK